MTESETARLRALEEENRRLKKLLAEEVVATLRAEGSANKTLRSPAARVATAIRVTRPPRRRTNRKRLSAPCCCIKIPCKRHREFRSQVPEKNGEFATELHHNCLLYARIPSKPALFREFENGEGVLRRLPRQPHITSSRDFSRQSEKTRVFAGFAHARRLETDLNF